MSRDRQEYEVTLVISKRVVFKTFSRTPEEAEADATNMYDDGDEGFVQSTDVEYAEAYPITDQVDIDEED